jgi:hypothetical protein
LRTATGSRSEAEVATPSPQPQSFVLDINLHPVFSVEIHHLNIWWVDITAIQSNVGLFGEITW